MIASKGYILYVHDDTYSFQDDVESNTSLIDYKLFCFNGRPKLTLVCTERFSQDGIKEDFYNEKWEHLDIKRPSHSNSSSAVNRPKHYDIMKELAAKLSENSSFSRIDFYEVNDNVYFGEITFYPMSGFEGFDTVEQDLFLGNMLKLPGGGYKLTLDGCVFYFGFKGESTSSHSLIDYKFYCFNGDPQFLYVSKGLEHHETAAISFLTLDWQFAPFTRNDYKAFNSLPEKPSRYDDMIDISRRLSQGHDFLRVDLYQIGERIYFSEMTFYPCSGFMPIHPKEWDEKIGTNFIISRREYY